MRVIDHEPNRWFLFEHGRQLVLDVNCSHGAVGYSVTIRLSPEEAASFAREGRDYLTRLARTIQDAGPGSPHQLRNCADEVSRESEEAFKEWMERQ